MNDVRWMQANGKKPGHEGAQPRPAPAPAPALTGKGTAYWVDERPATTIVGTRRSEEGMLVGRQLPEGEGKNVGGKNWGAEQNGSGDAVRVSIVEAAILQGFPPDYPWQGSRTKQYQQIGNAIPPPLAKAILEAVS